MISDFLRFAGLSAFAMVIASPPIWAADKIVHDGEHNILAAQHGERWGREDKEISAKLAEIRKKNGKPPNIVYILLRSGLRRNRHA